MMTVIHRSAFSSFYYWKKPVMDRLGCSGQNHHFIVVIGTQYWLVLSSRNHGNWLQGENFNVLPDLHTTRIIQIPIACRHIASPCLRPAVSSLGACPTPAL